MTQRILKKILFLWLMLFSTINGFSYDSDSVHPTINENALRQSTNLKFVLQNLGFYNDINSIVNNKEIYKWFREGGVKEDETNCRSKFHFHDPTKSWDTAGLSNVTIDSYCLDFRHLSSLVWAQDINNLWTWQKARQYFFDALIDSSKDFREQKFAYTFRSLGQIMHLISDSSVPAHTRNDIHIFPYTIPGIGTTVGDPTFESWTRENYKNLNYVGNIIDQSIFRQAVFNSSAPVAISALWDQDKYTGSNPDITVLTTVGLAEYSNANFFSEDTIFSDFSFPAWSSVVEHDEVIDQTSGKIRIYLRKIKDGETVNYLATGKWFYKYLPSSLKRSGLQLDEKVYEDYAQKLVPRAVGYSAGLLNYFFRGQMEAVNPREIQENGQITGITFNILNNTPGESMKPRINPQTGQNESKFVISYEYKAANNEIMYSISNEQTLNEEIASGTESTTEFIFTFPVKIPLDAQYVKYWLVYRGMLGNEADAVVGRFLPQENLVITPPDQFIYSIIDGSILPQQFTHIQAKVRSILPLQEVQDGTIYAVARYKKRTDYQPDLSTDPPSEESREGFYSSSESSPIILSPEDIAVLNSLQAKEFSFDFTSNPIPAGITDLYLQIFITGTVNTQTNTTIATGTKDLMEPTHHVFWNLTDMFSLDGHLYTSDQIKTNYNLASQVDYDHDNNFNEIDIGEPYIDPYLITFEIAYMAEPDPVEPVTLSATVENLPDGRYIRLIILVDRPVSNNARLMWSDNIDTTSAHFDFTFDGAVNQAESNSSWKFTTIKTFRYGLSEGVPQSIRQHLWHGVLRCQPYAVDPETGNHTCCYNEQEAIPADLTPYPAIIHFP